jgi:threonine aldolase
MVHRRDRSLVHLHLTKMRFMSAPWVGLLESGAWLRNAEHSNACARRLVERIADLPKLQLMFPVEANAVFLQMPDKFVEALQRRGWRFYTFIGDRVRFMFSWDASLERVDELASDLRAIALANAA